MSVYKPKGSPFYHFDFECKGLRFHGSTKKRSRREAEQVERAERVKAEHSSVTTGDVPHTFDDGVGRYWTEVGQFTSDPDALWKDLERLVDKVGPVKLLSEIRDGDIAELVAWRRGHRVMRNPKAKPEDCPLVSPATVNRSVTELMKRILRYARNVGGVALPNEPRWRLHLLAEPEERVRELNGTEPERLELATRDDYAPFFEFAKVSGLRLDECLLRWDEVNWSQGQIVKLGKGSKRVTAPITAAVTAILAPLVGHHPEFVFTYVARRTRAGKVKGRRYPLTYSGVKTQWRRLRKRAGVSDFRFHDFRHDLGTKLLRETGNLKLVQQALNHSDIRTTTKYAHVLDSEVAAALERVTESRNKSRNKQKKVG